MGMVRKRGQMELVMKDLIKMDLNTVKDTFRGLMDLPIMENLGTTTSKDLDSTLGVMDGSLMEIG